MTDVTPTNLVESEAVDADELDTGVEAQAPDNDAEPELDDDGDPVPPKSEEDELDEVDWDGKKYKLPKVLKPALMMQADYTRKTQELAEARRALAEQAQQQAQMDQQEVRVAGQVNLLEERLRSYEQIDWQAWRQQAMQISDPDARADALAEVQSAQMQRQEDQQTYGSSLQELNNRRAFRAETLRRQRDQELQDAHAQLSDPKTGIKGWSPEYSAKLQTFAVKELGLEPGDINSVRVVKAVNKAFEAFNAQRKATRSQSLEQAQSIRPAPKIGGNAGAGPRDLAALAKGDDFLAFEAALKRREAKGR